MRPSRGSYLLKRKLNPAAQTICGELQIDCPPELVGHELAYQSSPISGFGLNRRRGAAELAPCEYQDCRMSVQLAVPAHRHATSWHRQGAIFDRVGDQFVKSHSHCLNGGCCERHVRSVNGYVRIRCVRSELVTHKCLQSDIVPTLLAQQSVRSCHGLDAPFQ